MYESGGNIEVVRNDLFNKWQRLRLSRFRIYFCEQTLFRCTHLINRDDMLAIALYAAMLLPYACLKFLRHLKSVPMNHCCYAQQSYR